MPPMGTDAVTGTVVEPATGSIVLLTRLARVVYRQSSEDLIGMRLKSLGALAFLRDHEEASQQALSEGIFVDANSCVLLLNELEAAGYAERRRDPTDRRRHQVVLTPAGRDALERAEHAQGSIEDEILAPLDPGERANCSGCWARRSRAGARRRPWVEPGTGPPR